MKVKKPITPMDVPDQGASETAAPKSARFIAIYSANWKEGPWAAPIGSETPQGYFGLNA